MANELRLRQLAIGGLVEDAPLTAGATTLTSAGLASVSGGVSSAQHLAIVLDPDGVGGAPEIIYVTALTAGAGSATITRGQEGTTARQHEAGTPWVHAPTLRDITPNLATVTYDGGSADVDVTTTSTTFVDVDATHLAITFIVPQSGSVVVTFNAWGFGASSTILAWALREGSTNLASVYVIGGALSSRAVARFVVTGLTPGASKTYKWGQRSSTGTSVGTGWGTSKGAASMTVDALI